MRLFLTICAILAGGSAVADPPTIIDAAAQQRDGIWSISVTLRHPDTGWDHYADGWEVLHPDGNRLGYRELLHPHVNEQPFTRSLGGVVIPAGVDYVLIRARDNVAGWDDATFRLNLKR